MREELYIARAEFVGRRRDHERPTRLFLSPEAHARMCLMYEAKNLDGARFLGCRIHIVPTLEEGFFYA